MLLFGDIVVVEGSFIGVVCKSWKNEKNNSFNYDVYVAIHNKIKNYTENEVCRYGVRHKYLDETELDYQRNYELEK